VRRRDFITYLAARAQQAAVPTIGYLNGSSSVSDASMLSAFRHGLAEAGFVEGRNVAIDKQQSNKYCL
jgi:putative ABC transport system substrate-binding protein